MYTRAAQLRSSPTGCCAIAMTDRFIHGCGIGPMGLASRLTGFTSILSIVSTSFYWCCTEIALAIKAQINEYYRAQ